MLRYCKRFFVYRYEASREKNYVFQKLIIMSYSPLCSMDLHLCIALILIAFFKGLPSFLLNSRIQLIRLPSSPQAVGWYCHLNFQRRIIPSIISLIFHIVIVILHIIVLLNCIKSVLYTLSSVICLV